MAGKNGIWTPIQRRMLDVLSDGKWHTRHELFACLVDDLAGPTAVPAHVSMIRKKLDNQVEGIATMQLSGETYYQHVRKVAGFDS